MQQAKSGKYHQYVLSGDRMVLKEEIVVSDHVFVDNHGEGDERESFRAAKETQQQGGIALKWAAPLLVLMVFISLLMVTSKIALTQQLQEEYAQLHNRYQAAESERRELASAFSQKNDASDVCYYAVQHLGMRLATHEETIGVQIPGARTALQMDVAWPSASGAHQ